MDGFVIKVHIWTDLILMFSWLMTSSGYFLDEMECPDKIHRGIMSLQYWVPTGTPYRAWRTLPWRYFVIKPTNLPYADVGVFATTFIPKNTWLGEYEGDILPSQLVVEDILEHAWSAYTDGKEFHRIDAASVERSNWLRFVNCPNHQSEENISSHFCFGRVFFRTNTDIYPGQELLVYYGDGFAEYLGVYDYYYST